MKRLLLGLAVLMSACGSPTESIQEFVAQSGNGMRGQVTPVPPPSVYQPAQYTASELRDPFTLHAPAPAAGNDPRPREQLESYALETLRLLGTIERGGATVALVRSPDGLLHQVGTGQYMGLNSGRIATIEAAAVTLVETVVEDGEKTERSVRLALADAS